MHQAIGPQLTCVFVDTGLMREGEAAQVVETFQRHQGIELIHVDAGERFFERLAGRHRPEEKRKTIGELFIRIFEEHTGGLTDATLPRAGHALPGRDRERAPAHAAVIKSHHNVGGLPEDMDLELVEPLRSAVQGRGARGSAPSSACPTRSSGASRSPAPVSACASSAR